jgi:flagellar motor switch protein FliN/FliY
MAKSSEPKGKITIEESKGEAVEATQANSDIKKIGFPSFKGTVKERSDNSLDLLLDIQMKVVVELGRTVLKIKDILELGPGSIIELDKLSGEPVDILVNGSLVAKGEVVVIDENFAIRISDVAMGKQDEGTEDAN